MFFSLPSRVSKQYSVLAKDSSSLILLFRVHLHVLLGSYPCQSPLSKSCFLVPLGMNTCCRKPSLATYQLYRTKLRSTLTPCSGVLLGLLSEDHGWLFTFFHGRSGCGESWDPHPSSQTISQPIVCNSALIAYGLVTGLE